MIPAMPLMVLPVLVSSGSTVVQTTCDRLSADEIHVRCTAPPQLGSRASMALQLPGANRAEIVVGRVTETTHGRSDARAPGFSATFIDLPHPSRCRIAALIAGTLLEHRSFPRQPTQLPVRVGGLALRARDVSAVGIFVAGMGEEPGAVVDLELDLADGDEPARTQAVVIRRGGGLQFTDSKRDFRVRLDRYLASSNPPRGWA